LVAEVRLADTLFEQTFVYRLAQWPFAEDKLAPLLAGNDLQCARRVLDVGCGPGTNAALFAHADYIGVDINPRYIAWARRHYPGEFIVADIRAHEFPAGRGFDFVLVNSFLHHLTDEEVQRVLAAVVRVVSPEGFVHVLDLVLPEKRSAARWLARHDRGRHARSLEAWRKLFGAAFDVVALEPYTVALLGVPLWHMVYCKGRPKP
jgi:SAM-dependent methyltransferase